jgi:nicotinamide mononucleotide transporter
MSSITEYINGHYIEIIAMLLGLVSIVLQIRQSLWLWPVNIVMTSLYIIVFLNAKFYADMSLQVYYVIMSIYGWIYWFTGRKKLRNRKKLPIKPSSKSLWPILGIISVLLFAGISYILVNFTDSPVPYGDAFTTALSFIATWMLARKLIEHWIIWIVVDAVSVGLYFYKGLYPTMILFIVLTILAFKGYKEWKNEMEKAA